MDGTGKREESEGLAIMVRFRCGRWREGSKVVNLPDMAKPERVGTGTTGACGAKKW